LVSEIAPVQPINLNPCFAMAVRVTNEFSLIGPDAGFVVIEPLATLALVLNV